MKRWYSSVDLETRTAILNSMFYVFFIAIVNLAFGFALAMFLGGHYRMKRKFGFNIPFPRKSEALVLGTTAAVFTTESKPQPPADFQSPPE